MTIVNRSGLLAAVNTVQAYFDDNLVAAKVSIGSKQHARRDNQGAQGAQRVIFAPSAESGAAGTLLPPKFAGHRRIFSPSNPTRAIAQQRPLYDFERTVTVYVWACDPLQKENEQAQYEALESLLESTLQAIHNSPGAFASVKLGDVTLTPRDERTFGVEYRFEMQFRHPMFDRAEEIIYPTGRVNRGPIT